MTTLTEPTLAAIQLFKCLSDETRLQLMLLLHDEGELCVCELTEALNLSQPKVSRHLANLRLCGLLNDQRRGQWVYYRLADRLPAWARSVLEVTQAEDQDALRVAHGRLAAMKNRPNPCC